MSEIGGRNVGAAGNQGFGLNVVKMDTHKGEDSYSGLIIDSSRSGLL